MKKFFCFICLTCLTLPAVAQDVLSLDSCRALAIANNKELLIGQEKSKRRTTGKSGVHELSAPNIRYRRIYAQSKRVFSAE